MRGSWTMVLFLLVPAGSLASEPSFEFSSQATVSGSAEVGDLLIAGDFEGVVEEPGPLTVTWNNGTYVRGDVSASIAELRLTLTPVGTYRTADQASVTLLEVSGALTVGNGSDEEILSIEQDNVGVFAARVLTRPSAPEPAHLLLPIAFVNTGDGRRANAILTTRCDTSFTACQEPSFVFSQHLEKVGRPTALEGIVPAGLVSTTAPYGATAP